jgi:hypothetical protein
MRADQFPEKIRSRYIAVYRELERGQDPYAVDEVPEVLTRLPDVTRHATRYLAQAAQAAADSAPDALLALTEPDRFHRESEWVHICRAILWYPERPSTALGARTSEIASEHGHPARLCARLARVRGVRPYANLVAEWSLGLRRSGDRGDVWYAKYRLPDGRQGKKRIGPALSTTDRAEHAGGARGEPRQRPATRAAAPDRP